MLDKRTYGWALILAALLLVPSVAFAQSATGQISGTVADENGAALPGVTATATSPALQGEKVAVTDAGGQFRLVTLPPGSYSVTFALEGFQNVVQEDVRLGIAADVPLAVTMNSTFTDTVVVTGADRPLINTNTTESGVTLDSDYFENFPTARNYVGAAQVAPGAQTDASGTTFYGSTGAENAYYIDGVNTTGVELGQQGKELNFEFIDSVQVKTGAYGAEYGRNTGGIVEVVTKSGGNELTGDVFGYWDDDSLESDLSAEAETGAVQGSFRTVGRNRSDFGFDLGGALSQDKLWYFIAYDRVDNTDEIESIEDFSLYAPGAPSLGQSFDRETTRDLAAAKLTWKVTPTHTLAGSYFDDSGEGTGPASEASLAAPPSHWDRVKVFGAPNFAFNYDGVLSDNVLVSGRVSQHNEESKVDGPGASLVGFIDQSDPVGDGTIVWGWPGAPSDPGFGFFQNQEFGRDQIRADLTWFVNDVGGDHEFKFGAETEEVSVANANIQHRVYRFACDPGDCPAGEPFYYRHRFYTANENFDPFTATTADINEPLVVDTKAEDDAFFVQDSWRVLDNLTLNIGVRHDTQTLFNADGEPHQDLDDATAPRVGFIWDPLKNGRSKVYAHYGDFYETIPMDIVIRSYGGEITPFTYNFSQDPGNPTQHPLAPVPPSSRGGGFSLVDPETESQHIAETIIGGEYEITSGMSLGVKYIDRTLENVMEDALSADGHYFIGNPGRNLMTGTYDMGYAFGSNTRLHLLDEPVREFSGFEVTVTKRPTNNFQFLASVLFSELEGSYDGLFQASTGQLDPNLNSAFDYFDFSVNNTGKLSNDRPFQAKFDGSYNFESGITLGASAYWRDGLPVTAMGFSTGYQNWEYYLSERGAFGEADEQYEIDLHLGYPIQLANGTEINLLMDVFNLLDRQGELTRSNRYTNASESFTFPGGHFETIPFYAPLSWITGQRHTLDPNNPQVPATNPGFNTANTWQNPRAIRLGVRFSF